jgi:aldose 1-epimerase
MDVPRHRKRTFTSGDLVVDVSEYGGAITRIRWRDHDLLAANGGAGATLEPFGPAGFVMAPWANRIPHARFAWGGETVELLPNFSDGSAIHGEVFDQVWQWRTNRTLGTSGGQFGWPFPYDLEATIEVAQDTLEYSLTLVNVGQQVMPAGLGWHPWFASHRGELQLQFEARQYYEQADFLPVGPARPHESADPEFVRPRIPDWGFHGLFTELVSRRVVLEWTRRGINAELKFTGDADHLLVYASEEREAVAIEAQTHAPDGPARAAVGLSGGIAGLSPGESLNVGYRLAISGHGSDRTGGTPW